MASLVLGAAGAIVGGLLGGPIGASIGFSIGSAAGNLLDPQKIEGPRLTDLKLQTASYGAAIPIAYGSRRVAGVVIWQTDLHEHSQTSGGKGGPEQTTYSYTASFAVMLCEGPISDVLRIWADGRLVYDRRPGAAVNTFPFVFYTGTTTQEADPTMEGVLGVGNVPAYRGRAYVVFDEIDLSAYGHRIPNFEFEVITVQHADTTMNQVQREDGLPVDWYASHPIILQWPATDAGLIRIVAPGGTTVYEYNSNLTYNGSVSRSVDDTYPLMFNMTLSDGTTRTWKPIGTWITGGVPRDVWLLDRQYTVGSAVANVISGIPNPGVPDGEYMKGGCLTADRTGLFLFSREDWDSGNVYPTKWYFCRDGAVVDSGTVPTPYAQGGSGAGGGFPAFGNASYNTNGASMCSMAENNGKWVWMYNGLGTHEIHVFNINDNKELLYNVTVEGLQELGFNTALKTSIHVIQDGYAGLVFEDTLIIASRFAIGEGLKIPLADILSDISQRCGLDAGEIDVTGIDDNVTGYVLTKATGRSAIEALQTAFFFDPVESDGKVKFVSRGGVSAASIPDDDLAATASEEVVPLLTMTRQQEVELPKAVYVTYSNADADYQEGTQSAIRSGTLSESSVFNTLPVVFSDKEAKAVADTALFIAWGEREKFQFSTSRKYAKYEPTDVLTAHGRTIRIVEKNETPTGLIEWTGVAAVAASTMVHGSVPGSGEGFVEQTPPSIQGTTLRLLDIPLLSDNDSPYGFYAAMVGAIDTNWRGGTLYQSIDGGVNYTALQSATTAARIGTCSTTLGNFTGGNVFDESNAVTVQLTAGSADLTSSNELGVLNGANVCVIGSEVLQYKTATLTGLRTYVLSGLLRGRRGTEWAIATHAASELFTAFPQSLSIPGQLSEIGLSRQYKAVTSGLALSAASAESFANTGVAARTYAPCQLGGGRDASGNITLNWTRRDKLGGGWVDYSDVPMSETTEEYVVTIYSSATYATVKRLLFFLSETTTSYTSAEQTTDFGSNQSTIYWDVYQNGAIGYVRTRGVT